MPHFWGCVNIIILPSQCTTLGVLRLRDISKQNRFHINYAQNVLMPDTRFRVIRNFKIELFPMRMRQFRPPCLALVSVHNKTYQTDIVSTIQYTTTIFIKQLVYKRIDLIAVLSTPTKTSLAPNSSAMTAPQLNNSCNKLNN